MTLFQWLTLLGAPAICAGAIGIALRAVGESRRTERALREGIQALLRAQMIDDFNKWSEKGRAPIYARENFENCWKQYHALGANGVMDDIRKKFLELPTGG
ncbi:MAG: hypothetical protein IJV00_00105 [Clostridia bacterium]|nr:hypothetical protein [Clostridia bacterium]